MTAAETYAITMLDRTINMLNRSGRPRKRPGKYRPLATFRNLGDEPCEPAVGWAEKWSLPGAVRRATHSLVHDLQSPKSTVYRGKKMAEEAIVEAAKELGWTNLSFRPSHGIWWLDQECWDTREIVRIVRKARKTLLQKGT